MAVACAGLDYHSGSGGVGAGWARGGEEEGVCAYGDES